MSQKVEINGEEVEVFTTEEVAARETAVRTEVEGVYKPQLEDATKKLTAAEEAAAKRALEFGQFRKLSEEQVKQLSEKDAIIYANQLQIQEGKEREDASKKSAKESAVTAAIRSKVGTNEKLFTEAQKMYGLLGLDDATPEGIAQRVTAALGALGSTQPDLLAGAGFSGGSFEPPKQKEKAEETFADKEAGKELAGKLGLTLEEPKK